MSGHTLILWILITILAALIGLQAIALHYGINGIVLKSTFAIIGAIALRVLQLGFKKMRGNGNG